MIGITIGGTNQDAKQRLRESPYRTDATLMTFTLEGEGCAPRAAGKRSEYGCHSASGHECLIFRVSYCANRRHYHYHCKKRRLRYVAVFWRLSGKPQFTCDRLIGVLGAKAQGPDREIRRRIIYLPSGHVSPASLVKSEFRQITLYVRKWPCVTSNAGPHGDA